MAFGQVQRLANQLAYRLGLNQETIMAANGFDDVESGAAR
jgi:hypothetical protein